MLLQFFKSASSEESPGTVTKDFMTAPSLGFSSKGLIGLALLLGWLVCLMT
jgi:hypothetical protein